MSRPVTLDPRYGRRLIWLALAVVLAVGAVLVLRLTRGTTLWFDEWNFAVHRRSGGIHSLLATYNGHLSVVLVAIYKLLFAVEGIGSNTGYRLVLAAGDLFCSAMVFAYVRRRAGEFGGLLAAAALLFLGPGWQNLLWPFQIAWLIAIGAGVAALILLERRDRLGDIGAMCLLGVSLASCSVGVAVAVGVVADLLASRRPWRQWWIAGVPLLLYAAWSIHYQHAELKASNAFALLHFIAASAAAVMSAPLGLAGTSAGDSSGTILAWGAPLLVLAAVAVWQTRRLPRLGDPRVISLTAILAAFWILTALGRADLESPFASRYVFVDVAFGLLVAAELARGLAWTPTRMTIAGVVAILAMLSNIGILRDAGRYLRAQAPVARADLTALDLGRGLVPLGYQARLFPGYPFLRITAGDYYSMERAIGTPAYPPAALAGAPEVAREFADEELVHIHDVTLAGATGQLRTSGCVRREFGFSPVGTTARLVLPLPSRGVVIRGTAPVSVAIRRFADVFDPLGTLAAGAKATLQIGPDGSAQPWLVQLSTAGPLTVCRLAA